MSNFRLRETEEKTTTVEFRLVEDDELPPIVITMNADDKPKVIINSRYKIWLGLHRECIAGIFQNLPEKINELLTAYLADQRMLEKEFGDMS